MPPDAHRDRKLLDGRYRLLERINRGGTATVWRAHDTRLSRLVAVKLLDPRPATGGQARECMRVEAQALAQLAHPHIAEIYDYGEADSGPYLVMELIAGRSLADALNRAEAMPWRTAVAICAQVADAMAAAHARGVVHRDVTAANVMLTATGVKLIDFGVCEVEGGEEAEPDGSVCGTPAYVAPERLDGQPVHPAADTYSFGVLLYRALSGHLPWQADTPRDLLLEKLHRDPPPLPAVAGLPAAVDEICMRCLARDTRERPTARELAETLRTAVPEVDSIAAHAIDQLDPSTRILRWSQPTGRTRPPHRTARRRRIVVTAARIAAAPLGALLVWSATGWMPDQDPVPPVALGAPPQASAVGTAAAPDIRCAVTYRLTSDTGRTFAATIAVTNDGTDRPTSGRLTFYLPGDQRIEQAASASLRQVGPTVTSAPLSAITPPGGTARLTLVGRYATTNPLPTQFSLDGQPCTATVLATTTVTTAAQLVSGPPEPEPTPAGGKPARPRKDEGKPPAGGTGGAAQGSNEQGGSDKQ